MLKGKFEIKEVKIANAIPKELYLKVSAKLIEYSLGNWGNISKEDKEYNEKVLKLGQGAVIGSYVIDTIGIFILTVLETGQTNIVLTEDLKRYTNSLKRYVNSL